MVWLTVVIVLIGPDCCSWADGIVVWQP